jgi:capsule polysaccharide export protein KpsE/RkpR
MTRAEAIRFAKQELLDGADSIDVISQLEVRGFSPLEAEEIVDQAMFDLENEHE